MNQVAATEAGTIVQAGRDVHLYEGCGGVGLPYRFGRVPPLAAGFQRRSEVDVLEEALAAGGVPVVAHGSAAGRAGVVAGLGGVGKTQLAADYAHRAWDTRAVELLVWVTATSRDAVVGAYHGLAADLTGDTVLDARDGAQRALAWLASCERPWLVVLDDVQTAADLTGLWPPRTPHGRTLLTTRRRDTALTRDARTVSVGLFTPAESLAYLTSVLADRPHLLHGAAEMAATLGHLPLALSQAAAYLADRGLTCADYTRRFTDRRRTLPEVLPEPGALPDEHHATVATTWSLSIDAADQLHPLGLARPLLEAAALLDPNGIPADLFTTPAMLTHLTAVLGRDVDDDTARDGLACLHRLHLITHDPATPHLAVRVHALVQRAARENTPDRHTAPLAHVLGTALQEVWRTEVGIALAAALRANTAVLHTTTTDHLWTTDARRVLQCAANSLGNAGQPVAAHHQVTGLLDDHLRVLGPDHRDTLAIRYSQASWRAEAGDVLGAVTDLTDLLDDYLRILGPDHQNTLDIRQSLAWRRGEARDYEGQGADLADLLEDYLRVLGPDHPNTLDIRQDLAEWRANQGDYEEAVAAYTDLLNDYLRVLGPDHPKTLDIREQLAYWQWMAADTEESTTAHADLLADILNDYLRVLGPDHPKTLDIRDTLALRLGDTEGPAEAVAAYTDLLKDYLRVLGPDHPKTLDIRDNLAVWRRRAGDVEGASAAFADVANDRLRLLRPDHSKSLVARQHLATLQGRSGDVEGAVTAYTEIVNDYLRIVGPDGMLTFSAQQDLAYWQKQMGAEDH